MNPFKYGCVVGGENYCSRPELQRQLAELVRSGQNVVVQGPRRMGKTSLVVETVKSLRGVTFVYADFSAFGVLGSFAAKSYRPRQNAASAHFWSGRRNSSKVCARCSP